MHYSLKLSQAIGKVARLRVDKLSIDIRVLNTREVWGRVDCLVEPLSGGGTQWISFDRLSPVPDGALAYPKEWPNSFNILEFPNT